MKTNQENKTNPVNDVFNKMNENLPKVETVINPSVYNTLQFERDIPEWSFISMALNLLLFHSIKSLGNDGSLSDEHTSDCMQSLMSLKQEIDRSVQYTLSYIPKQ